jgi:hypothetical protein
MTLRLRAGKLQIGSFPALRRIRRTGSGSKEIPAICLSTRLLQGLVLIPIPGRFLASGTPTDAPGAVIETRWLATSRNALVRSPFNPAIIAVRLTDITTALNRWAGALSGQKGAVMADINHLKAVPAIDILRDALAELQTGLKYLEYNVPFSAIDQEHFLKAERLLRLLVNGEDASGR